MTTYVNAILVIMIAYLKGTVAEKGTDFVVIDVHGVGYGLRVCAGDWANLTSLQEVKMHIYEHIREDVYDLYGFLNLTTKQLYEQLLSVKNVGPKVALAVLDIGPEATVRQAIANGDVKLLQSAKGVGKRAAEQMVVELRDKVGLVASADAEDIVNRGGVQTHDEAHQALVALGFNETDAQVALQSIDPDLPTEERITLALKRKN